MRPRKKAALRVEMPCPKSPTGHHELADRMLLGHRDDKRFPCGTYVFAICCHCGAEGQAFLEDNQIRWQGGR